MEAPIFPYDPRYHLENNTNDAILYKLQSQILEIIKKGSFNIKTEIKTTLHEREVETILHICHEKRMVNRKKIGTKAGTNSDKRIPVYLYFTNREG